MLKEYQVTDQKTIKIRVIWIFAIGIIFSNQFTPTRSDQFAFPSLDGAN